MKVLVVGSGGREHALVWKLSQDDPSLTLFAAPGNPGIAALATCVPIDATDVEALADFAGANHIDLTVVGPEAALAAGIVDRFRAEGLAIFGPTRAAAEIETSKAFAKQLMIDAGVPTARAVTTHHVATAKRAATEFGAPVVIKASGLAAGKGVVVASTLAEANAAIELMLEGNAFGDAGHTVLVEEFMEGEELSLFAITDGTRVLPLIGVQDHKRLLDDDRGPNTGGMGAYAPVSVALPDPAGGLPGIVETTVDRVFLPTLAAMRERGRPFTGLLYAGLMLTADGPKVVEFNCRFGDPETQAILPLMRFEPSLLDLMLAVGRGDPLPTAELTASGFAVSTVLAAAGYPEKPRTGDPIDLLPAPDGVVVFHAGTRRDVDGRLVTAGGRVLAVTGLGSAFEEAHRRSAAYAESVRFAGKQFRTDIGWRELARRAGAS